METPAILERCFALRAQGAGVRTEVRADLVTFDRRLRVLVTMVGGRVVYQRKGF